MIQLPREYYLQQLIDNQWNGLVKVICGLRRSGKSYLLFHLFRQHLLSQGVAEADIIALSLEEDANAAFREPEVLGNFLRSRLSDSSRQYYVLLDEIQFAITAEELRNHDCPIRLYGILNELLNRGNVDVYVTGSNSKMLSTDILTEFRGRGDVIEVYPLSFREYYGQAGGEPTRAYEAYLRYGGMPLVWRLPDDQRRARYLTGLFDELFLKDILERYRIDQPHVLAELTEVLCSSIGSLTNVNKLLKTLASVKGLKLSHEVIANDLDYLTDAFLFRCARRYDVKGKKYFSYPSKYYCADLGLRNARLNWRQQEETHLQENVIFNELIARGYSVDVGVVEMSDRQPDGQSQRKATEIDFIANWGMKRYYIQSALSLDGDEKARQEVRPLLAVKDLFRKVIITKTAAAPWLDERGVLHLGIYDFLLNPASLDG